MVTAYFSSEAFALSRFSAWAQIGQTRCFELRSNSRKLLKR